jgi:hypothetical protein
VEVVLLEPDLYCSGIFKLMPRWDRYIDVFGATFNGVITSHLFCDVLKIFIVQRLITLTHNTSAQTLQCASMLVVLVAVEAISNHLFVAHSDTDGPLKHDLN